MEVSGRTEAETKTGTGENIAVSLLCQPCGSEGENVPAESYCVTCEEFICSSCLRAHRKLSLTKNHVIKAKHEMPPGLPREDPCSELCAAHKREIVKFYCEGHNEVGCGDCMVLQHKTCKVELVQKVSSNYINSEELNQIKIKTEHLAKEINSWKQKIKSNIAVASEINVKVVEELKKFRKDIDSYLDNAEAEILMEVKQLNIKNESLQKKLQDKCDSMGTDVKDIQHSLETHSDKVNQLFVTAKQAQKKLQMCQESIQRMETECRIYNYSFEPSKDLVTLKKKKTSIGSILVHDQLKRGALPGQKKSSMVDIRAEFAKKLNIKERKDRDCWITRLALIADEELLLVDRNNNCLKILDVKESKITSRYSSQPPTAPWDVTVINADTAAATFPDAGKIVFLNIKNGLTESHNLNGRTKCMGIDHKDGIIAVSFCSPSALQLLNIQGDVLHDFRESSMFDFPSHLALSHDGKSIFVSDFSKHTVFEVRRDCQSVATIKLEDNSYPIGLVVTSDGTVVVCCQSNAGRVSMILPNSKEIQPLSLQHVQIPDSIIVCEKQNKIYISEIKSSRECNYIKTFDMK